MAEMRLGEGPFFDRGIDRIVQHQDGATPVLPTAGRLAPADLPGESHLDRLFRARGFEGFLDDALRPRVDDRDLLLPAAFTQALRQARSLLQQRSEALRDPRSAQARTLGRAARLLSEEDELRGLVRMYCATLYQG